MQKNPQTVNEQVIQALLMLWTVTEKNHAVAIPSMEGFYKWEADLVSVMPSGMTHEFEIKLSRFDYSRENRKSEKHALLGSEKNTPSYFWYVTYQFDIEPPEFAGWMNIRRRTPEQDGAHVNDSYGFEITVQKEAPRLNTWKIGEEHWKKIARTLNWKMINMYRNGLARFLKEG